MRTGSVATVPAFFLMGCSVLVQIDDEDYRGVGNGDGALAAGAADDESTAVGAASGDRGGTTALDGPGGSATGVGGGETGGNGTGGEPIMIPEPVHYYSLDQIDGTAVTDSGGLNLIGRVTDQTSWAPQAGVAGGAYEVTKHANSYLELPNTVTSNGAFVLSWWFVIGENAYRLLVSKTSQQADVGGYSLISDSGAFVIRIGDTSTTEMRTTATHPPAEIGDWTHVALGYSPNVDGTKDRVLLWVNGENVLDDKRVLAHSGENTGAAVRFGFQEGGSAASPFNGVVDEIRVFDRILDDDEVRSLYEFDRPPAQEDTE